MTLQQIGQVFLADLQRARSLDIPRGMVVLRTGPRRRGVVSTWPCTDISDKHKKTWPIVGENSQAARPDCARCQNRENTHTPMSVCVSVL